jgi:hypothetical protein
MMDCRHYPTPEQLHEIERLARRERVKVIARIFSVLVSVLKGLSALKALIVRGASMLAGVNRGAGRSRRNIATTSLRSEP